MTVPVDPLEIEIRKTIGAGEHLRLAASLPGYFSPHGLELLRADLAIGETYSAFAGSALIGFVLYKAINPEAIELAWLAVNHGYWSRGVGTRLVNDTLARLPAHYRVCEVKTLAATVPDAGYARTRRFYAKIGFIPLEVIDPYPSWEPGNPCQLLVRCLSR